jgi:transitional endoplasmic reticulum ATPase
MRNDMPISESLLAQVLLPADEIQLRQPAEHAGTQNLLVLTPAQQKAAGTLNGALAWSCVAELRSRSGMGRTAVLRHVCAAQNGAYLGVRDFVDAWMAHAWSSIERATHELFEHAISTSGVVVIDDVHLITAIVEHYRYTQTGLFDAILGSLLKKLAPHQRLVFGTDMEGTPSCVRSVARRVDLNEFGIEDYRALASTFLGTAVPELDFVKIHRFAPSLTADQLKSACGYVSSKSGPLPLVTAQPQELAATDSFMEYLRSVNLISNVTLDEVQAVTWADLRGVDDVVQALEAKIALPFEDVELAAELQLKPKRGVLLAGPPGTGKTTVGRALAHRLKGKFFLIDGTVIAGSSDFYDEVGKIFEAAKANAPSVIFIDDADVIFENESERGFYRYLLTLLDGMESARSERVCVMLTAMNVSSLPAALLRSGRIELWLEMRLPDEAARASIIREKLAALPEPLRKADAMAIAAASRGMTGADIKAMVDDAKLVFAHERVSGRGPRKVEDYFLEAIRAITLHKKLYAMRKPGTLADTVRVGYPI